MTRSVSKPARGSAERAAAALACHEMVGGPRTKPKRRKGATKSVVKKWCREFEQMRADRDFEDMMPRHFVGMYVIAHLWLYGVPSSEVVGKAAQGAASACKKMLREEFDNDNILFLQYLRHTFKREKETEKWRRQNNTPGKRLTYRELFVWRSKLDDFRVAMARKEG